MSSMILMRCPVTRAAVSTGLMTDKATYRLLRSKKSQVHCSACGGMHDWWDTKTWLARVLDPSQPDTRPQPLPVSIRPPRQRAASKASNAMRTADRRDHGSANRTMRRGYNRRPAERSDQH